MSETFSIWHYDGNSAVRRAPEIEVVGDSFLLVDGEGRSGPYRFADIVHRGTQGDAEVYGIDTGEGVRDGWRLGLTGAIPPDLAARLPAASRYGGWIDRIGLTGALVAFAMVSLLAIVAIMRAPEFIAPLVPSGVEENIGDALVGDFGGRFCSTPEGKAALNKMVAALDPDPSDLNVEVANIDMVNAAALPGKNILLFDGLLAEAESPDEVAGVLAHELGHVREGHVMQGFLRQMGLSVLLAGFEGNVGSTVNGVLAMSYGREAEREADDYSLAQMLAADISPAATAKLFERWEKDEKEMGNNRAFLGYLSSHPLSGERRKKFESGVGKRKFAPSLTRKEWLALQDMCDDDPDVEGEGELF